MISCSITQNIGLGYYFALSTKYIFNIHGNSKAVICILDYRIADIMIGNYKY